MKTQAWKAYWESSLTFVALVLLCAFMLPVNSHATPLPWSTKAPMPTPRSRVASGVINGKIFVLGGANSSAVEMYDPATDVWRPWSALTETVFAPCQVTKGDTIYMVSLNSSAVVAYNTNIHAFGLNPVPNPNSSGFTSVVGYLNTPRTGRAQATILNNKMYVVGTGANMDTIEEFDLTTHVSVTKQTRLPSSRDLPLVAAVGGKIYIMGGAYDGIATNTCWEYDPASDSITNKGPLPIAMAGNSASAWGGKIYIPGGTTSGTFPPTSGDPTVRQYDPTTDSWTAFDGLPTWRYAAATEIVNGVLYVIGGDTGQAPNNTAVNEAATLPLNSGNWLSRDPIQTPQNIVVHAGATTINDRIYVLGGRNMSGGPGGLDAVYSYAPQSGMPWQVEPNLSVPVVGAPAASYGPMIYLAGGEGTDIIQYYNTATIPHSSGVAATLRYPRIQPGATVLNNKLYVIGGATAAIEEFDLTTSPITRTDRVDYLPDAIQQPGVVAANGKIYIMGGTPTTGPGTNYISDACIVYTPGGQPGPFALCSPMPVAVNENQGAVLSNGKIYLAGGAAYGASYPGDTAALQAYDPITDSWEVVDTMTSARRDHSLVNLNGRMYVMGGHNPVSMVEEWIKSPAGSGPWTVQSVSPGYVNWLSTAHPPVSTGSYLRIGGVYYYVAISWAGPGYNTAQLQQCDQANGTPLTTTQWVCDESCYNAIYPVPANVPPSAVGQPIVQYASWSQTVLDNVPPTTYVSLSGTPGAIGTYVSDVQLSLTASDNPGGSGVATTFYSYDGMAWGPYTAPVTINANGFTTIYYRSSDNAGNQEAIQQVTVNIVRTQGSWVVNSVYPLTGSGVDWLASQHSTVPYGSYLKIAGTYYYVSSSNPGTWGDSSNTVYNTAWLFQCNQATGAILTTVQQTCDEFGCTQTSFPQHASLPISAQGQPIELFLSFPLSQPGATLQQDDFETGNLSRLNWNRGGDGFWNVNYGVGHTGNYGAEAPVSIGDGQSAYLEFSTSLAAAGMVSFWYRVSSESNFDYLRFKIDGMEQRSWSGEIGWNQVSFPVQSGFHTFRWEYTKDGSVSTGSDTVWIDEVLLSANTAAPAGAPWPMAQHDPQLTGKGTAVGPSAPGVKWNQAATKFIAGTAVGADGTIYAAGIDGRAYALRPDGSVKYTYNGVGVCCVPPAIGPDGTIYFSGNQLYALNPDFSLKWVYGNGGACCGAMIVGADGTIYVANGALHAVNPMNGTARWVFWPPTGVVVASPAISHDGFMIYVPTTQTLYALAPGNGGILWQSATGNLAGTPPVVGPDGTVFVSSVSSVQVLSPGGVPLRQIYVPQGKQPASLAYDATNQGGTLIATVYPYSIDPATGATIWGATGEVFAFDPNSGSVRWAQSFQGGGVPEATVVGGPVPEMRPSIDSQGTIYLAANEFNPTGTAVVGTHLYAFGASGSQLFNYYTPATFPSDTRVLSLDNSGTLYLLADGNVTAFWSNSSPVSIVTTATPPGGAYGSPLSISLNTNVPATIYYTLNGSDPTTGSSIYNGPISISVSATLKFFARDAAGNSESVKTVNYILNGLPLWRIHDVKSGEPSWIDWLSEQHGYVATGEHLRVNGTLYYVNQGVGGSWNGPQYNAVKLQQCDQATGQPLTATGSCGSTCGYEYPCGDPEFCSEYVCHPIVCQQPLLADMTGMTGYPISGTDGTTGTWSVDGFMATPRMNHTATPLPNGYVLVAGGFSSFDNTPAIGEMLYDPTINGWSLTSSMATPRGSHTATLLPNGKVLVAGGYIANYNATSSAELYDPATSSWSPAGSMATARVYHTTTLLSNGKVLVVGGYSADYSSPSTAELYDPATNSWSSAGSMATGRARHTATQLPNGKVLVAGGGTFSAELYDPVTNSWSSGGSMATVRYEATATQLSNGLVLVAGGHNGPTHSTAELYDPATNSWLWAGSMSVARESHTATVLPNGKVLVAGGRNFTTPPTFYTNATAELFDPATNSWSSVGAMANERYYHTATLLPNGKVLVSGGATNNSVLASAELFVPGGPGGEIPPMTTATPSGGIYGTPQTVVLTSNVPATIYYTLDGSTPSTASPVYYGPLYISSSTTIRFFARSGSGLQGTVQTAVYTIQDTIPPTTTAFPAGGTYSSPINVSLTASEPATIYYTLNGVEPTTASPVYSGPISISSTTVLKFFAMDGAGNVEYTKVETYTITAPSGGNGAWSFAGSLLTARAGQTSTLLPNGKVLVAGGENAGADAELFDPATNSWSSAGTMAAARVWHTATLLPNGKVLVAGGRGTLSSAELYDPATNSWSSAGSMTEARVTHTAILLRNGKVLIAGGLKEGSGYLSSAELYDPATNSWSQTGPLITARDYFTATLLPNNKVLVVGGGGPPSGILSSAELFDPATGTWSAAGSMAIERFDHTATLLPNGKVLVAGGIVPTGTRASVELYDPATNSWSAGAPMITARESHNATLLPNGKLLVNGGVDESLHSLTSAELYDPAANSWSPAGSLATGRYLSSSTLLPDGRVLVAGGYDFSASRYVSTTEIYNPAASNWSSAGYMANEREGHTATLLPNGKVLLAGGWGNNGPPASAEIYEPATNSWSTAGSLVIPRYEHTATLLPNGKVLVAGGLNTSGPLASVEIYDPTTNSWSLAASMSTARHLHTATLLANGKVLVAGATGESSSRSAELYDPATNSWSAAGSLATGRYYHTATMLTNGKVLVTAGRDSGYNVLASAELYDPASNSWSTAGNLASGREWHAASLLPNGRVLVTGGFNSSGALSGSELYDPASNSWSIAASMANARSSHAATLLGSGDVLVSGGSSGEELYHPATNSWSAAGAMTTPRSIHTATLLPTGKVLVTGGIGSPFYLYSAELYDQGIGFTDARRPVISSISKGTGSLLLTGYGFTGDSDGSGGTTNNSSTGYPLVQLRRIDNGAQAFVVTDPVATWSGSSITINDGALSGLADGPYMVTVYASGIPSLASYVSLSRDTTSPLTTATPPGGTYNAPQTVTLTASEQATIYFTTDGSEPTTASPVYSEPISIAASTTLKFFARDAAGNRETPVKTELYAIRLDQSISFGTLPAKGYGDAAFDLSATATSGLPVTFTSSNPAVATVSGNTVTIVGVGTTEITASQVGDGIYSAAASVAQQLTVNKAVATLTLGNLTATYDGTPKAASAITNPAGLAFSLTYDGAVTAPAAGGSYTVAGTINDVHYQGSASGTLTIAKAATAITISTINPASSNYGDQVTMTATVTPATAGGKVQFGNGQGWSQLVDVSGGTARLTTMTIPAGVNSITAQYQGDGNYLPATSSTVTQPVNKGAQTITFLPLATKTIIDAPFALGATSSSGLPIAYTSSNPAVATVSGNTVTIVGLGSTTIIAGQWGDGNYNAASTAVQTLTVTKATATIAFGNLGPIYDGTPKLVTATTTPAGLALTITYNGSATPPTSAGSYPVVATINDASYQGSGSDTLVIGPAGQTITCAALPVKTYGDPAIDAGCTASSGLEVHFASSNPAVATFSGNTITIVGAGTTTIVASQEGNGNYSAATPLSQPLTVNKAAATVTLGNLTATYSGTAKAATATTSPAGLNVAFTYNTSPVAPTMVGSYTVVGTISDANYQGSATGTMEIAKAPTTMSITGATPNPSTHGQAVTVTAIVSPAGGGGKVQFSNGQEWIQLVDVTAGGTATITSSSLPAGGNTITAQYLGDGNHNQSPLSASFTQIVNRTSQTINFAPLAIKVLGDPGFSLNATSTSGLPVIYTSTNTAVATVSGNTVTIVGLGTTTIIASQWGDSDYNAAVAVSQPLTVISAQQGIKINDGGSDSYFTTITAAYNGITSGTNVTMQLPNVTLSDVLVFDKNYQLTLMGGYDSLLGTYSGVTTIQGSVVIQGGSVIFDGVCII